MTSHVIRRISAYSEFDGGKIVHNQNHLTHETDINLPGSPFPLMICEVLVHLNVSAKYSGNVLLK